MKSFGVLRNSSGNTCETLETPFGVLTKLVVKRFF